MKDNLRAEAENEILFCARPWRLLGGAVLALIAVTFLWGFVVLGTYQDDDRFGEESSLSVTDFMMRNIGLPGSLSLPDAIMPAVVGIDGERVNGGVIASGAIVGASGYVLTTLHTVENLPEITIRVWTASGLKSFGAQIVKKAPSHDLVMLKIKSPGSFLYLSLANTGAGPGGGPVFAFGQGERGGPVVRQGMMADRPVELTVAGLTLSHLRPTDAVYSWEQNGGPVVDKDGALAGISLAVQDAGGATKGFVVPADVIDAHFRDVVDFKMAAAPAVPAASELAPRTGAAVAIPAALPMAGMAGNVGMMPGVSGWQVPPNESQALGGSAAWWLRAANQVAGPGGVAVGVNTAPNNGPPLAAGAPSAAPVNVDHVLGTRIAGFSIEDLIGLTVLAIVKGVIGGMMTMGGGVFLVAGMMMFFGYGLFLIRPVAYLTNIFVYSASTIKHNRNGLIMWDKVRSLAPWAVIGVIAGYFIGNSIGDRLVEILLGIFAVLIAIKGAHEVLANAPDEILLTKNGANGAGAGGVPDDALSLDDEDPLPARARRPDLEEIGKSALLALPMGIVSGILGITGGVVEVPLQHYIGKVPLKNAIANSAALVFCASLTGTILSFAHGISTGLIDWAAPLTLAAILIPASFAGGIVGAHLTKLAPKRPLKAVFSVLMLAVAIRMFMGH